MFGLKSSRTKATERALRVSVEAFQKGRAPFGVTAAVVRNGAKPIAIGVGPEDKPGSRRIPADAVMLQASIGKMYVGAVAAALVKEGKLGLADPISNWLGDEDWLERLPNWRDVTVGMLLNHSSGMIDHVPNEKFYEAVIKHRPDADYVFSPRDCIEFVLDLDPLFPAGEGFGYSDTGYLIAGMIIEKAAGQSYYDELCARFLDPLKLKRTFAATSRKIPHLAPGHMAKDNPYGLPEVNMRNGVMVYDPSSEWTGGGLASSSGDMAIFAWHLFATDIVCKDYLAFTQKWSRALTVPVPGFYGLGVLKHGTPLGDRACHGGWTPGYRTDLAYYPDHDMAVAVMANTDIEDTLTGDGIMELALNVATAAAETK